MGSLHQRLMDSEFSDRYRILKTKLPRIKHLIHGGIENFYSGLNPEHLKSAGKEIRLSNKSIDRTLSNIELGLERIMGLDITQDDLYIHCHPRSVHGEKTREALWQYDIFADYQVVATIGVNFHTESEKIVATIANIQGQDSEGIKTLREICGVTPWTVKSLTLILDYLPADVKVVRGVPSVKHPFKGVEGWDNNRSSNLYDMSFRKVGMDPIRDDQGKVNYYELRR
jgi:hypothetical protein